MSGVKKKGHDMHAVSNRIDAIEQTEFRVRAACIAGSSHAVQSSQTAPLAVFLLPAAIEKFLTAVVWDRS